jgi:hypothetical protein
MPSRCRCNVGIKIDKQMFLLQSYIFNKITLPCLHVRWLKWRSQFLEPRGIDKCQRCCCCSNINFCFASKRDSLDSFHQTRGVKISQHSAHKEIPLIIILLLSTRVKNKNYKLIITKSVFYDPRKYQLFKKQVFLFIQICALCVALTRSHINRMAL